MSSLKGKTARTQRGKRALAERAPKLVENVKQSLIMKGPKLSEIVNTALKDIHKLHTPHSEILSKHNDTRPFEDASSVEFLTTANNCSLFAYGSHSKKRPHSLILGRLFDGVILDMMEFGINAESFKSMKEFDSTRTATVRYASKPLFLFQGAAFDTNNDLAVVRSLLLDFFRGEILDKINLNSLDHIIIVTANEATNNTATTTNTATTPTIHFRHYGLLLKRSSSRLPRIELSEVGPSMDLSLRRRVQGSNEVVKESMKQVKVVKQKNIERNEIGDRLGRIHMKRQNYDNIAIAKMKGLKKRKSAENNEENAGAAEGNGEEKNGNSTAVASKSAKKNRLNVFHDGADEFASSNKPAKKSRNAK